MLNPDGTYTRDEHEAAIMGLYIKNLESGMEPEVAIACAGKEWRKKLKKLGEAKIAYCKAALGLKE
jgi:hypothetical protein